jgi:hypothetical protein
LNFLGFYPGGIIWNVKMWRYYLSFCVIVATIVWMFFGFDSTWSQTKPFLDYFAGPFFVDMVTQPIQTVQSLPNTIWHLYLDSRYYYGMGNHFSAPVIYGSAFLSLSLYFEDKLGWVKSHNFCTTTALSLMNIGLFEWFWNLNYAFWQGQWWTVTFKWKQVTNLIMFTIFIVIGILTILYEIPDGYRLNTSTRTKFLFLLTGIMIIFWVFYPLPVDDLTIETSTGTWSNTNRFPQTFYAVDVDPTDDIAIGVPNYVENDIIHFINTFTKITFTWSFLSLVKFKRVEK